MPTVADQLREAREKRKLSVYDVAAATKIRTDHVRALEEGNYRMFAAPVYIRGFVRSYANLLKLDASKLMADLDLELSAIEEFREPSSLMGKKQGAVDTLMLRISKVNWPLAVGVVGCGLILTLTVWSYRAWQNHQTRDPLAGVGPGVYQPPETNVGEVLPLPRTPRRP
ncbi:MAG: helix-turn-helix domain-containing protein [Verrucomicrobia bacterium]|nr:helix-turn-helix domain-containing protein [Verrucomicrobiota bacterium]